MKTTKIRIGYPYASSNPDKIKKSAVVVKPSTSATEGFATVFFRKKKLKLLSDDPGPKIVENSNVGLVGELLESDEENKESIFMDNLIIAQGRSMQLALVLASCVKYDCHEKLPLVLFSAAVNIVPGNTNYLDATIDVYCRKEDLADSIIQKYEVAKYFNARALVLPIRDANLLAEVLGKKVQAIDKIDAKCGEAPWIIGVNSQDLGRIAQRIKINPRYFSRDTALKKITIVAIFILFLNVFFSVYQHLKYQKKQSDERQKTQNILENQYQKTLDVIDYILINVKSLDEIAYDTKIKKPVAILSEKIFDLEKHLKIKNGYGDVLKSLSLLLNEKFNEAKTLLRKVKVKNQGFYYHYLMGVILFRENKLQQARSSFNKAKRNNLLIFRVANAKLENAIAMTYTKENIDETISRLEKIDFGPAKFNLAAMYARKKEYQKMRKIIVNLIEKKYYSTNALVEQIYKDCSRKNEENFTSYFNFKDDIPKDEMTKKITKEIQRIISSSKMENIFFGTSNMGSSPYQLVGKFLKNKISYLKIDRTDGSLANLQKIKKKNQILCLSQSDVLKLKGNDTYAAIASLLNEKITILVKKNDNINNVEDLKNKTVNVFSNKSGSCYTAKFVKEVLRISDHDFSFKESYILDIENAFKRLELSNENPQKIHAIFLTISDPYEKVQKRLKKNNLKLIDIQYSDFKNNKRLCEIYQETSFSKENYNIPNDVKTFFVPCILTTAKDSDTEIIKDITLRMCKDLDVLERELFDNCNFDLRKNMFLGIPVPLHNSATLVYINFLRKNDQKYKKQKEILYDAFRSCLKNKVDLSKLINNKNLEKKLLRILENN